MAEIRSTGGSASTADCVLGRKLDSIPFSAYHIMIIAVLGLVGFVEGYDLSMTGSLLVLAKAPLHLTGADIRWLAVGPDVHAVRRRLHGLSDIRSLEPQDHHADRRVRALPFSRC